MRDTTTINLPKDTIYKDVVVIGNGPSGISLSYMLSGNWPYWIKSKISKHPDELLRARLNYANHKKSLVLQDLVTLADGLEGRSTNPVSLLLDSLQHPCADLGMELPSMLEYKFHPEKHIDHIVIGKGNAGGSWHRMDPNLRTLSLSAWMSLPGLDFNKWELKHPPKSINDDHSKLNDLPNLRNSLDVIKNLNDTGGTQTTTTTTTNEIKKKSCHKCDEMKFNILQHLQINNNNNSCNKTELVNNNETEIGALCCKCSKKELLKNKNDNQNNKLLLIQHQNKQINQIKEDHYNDEIKTIPQRRNLSLKRQNSKEVQTRALISRVAEYYESYVTEMGLEKNFLNNTIVTTVSPLLCQLNKDCEEQFKDARWIVCGFNRITGKKFCIASKNVVLANGSSDLANRLGLKGEGSLATPWLKHELPQLESALEVLTEKQRSNLKPVLIVGAGLSAADAVTICRLSGINVIHVYRNRTAGLDKMLPENVYPEYHEVHKMMKDSSNNYDYYTPLPEHTITDINHIPTKSGGHIVTVQHLKTGELKNIEISYCTILIGSRPDFRFLINLNQKNDNLTTTNTPTGLSVQQKCDDNIDCHQQQQQQHETQKWNKKISWLKTICAKCKHINLCDKSVNNNNNNNKIIVRTDYKRICGHNNNNNNNISINNNKNINCNKLKNCNENDTTKLDDLISGIGLGENQLKPIDCKINPISVDKYTNKILNSPNGLYAIGPLVSDNFIRFIPGGALSVTSSLHKEND